MMWWRFIITFLGVVHVLCGAVCAPDLNSPQNPELAAHHERDVSVAETSRDSPECRPDNAPSDAECAVAVDETNEMNVPAPSETNIKVGILTIRGTFKGVEIREAGGEILIKNDGDAPVEIPVQRMKEHAKLYAVDERGVLIPIIDKIVAPPGQKRLRVLDGVPDIRREGRAVEIKGKKEVAVEVDADSFYAAPTNVPGAPEEMLAVFSFEKNVPAGGSVKVRISVPEENVRLWKFDGKNWTPIEFRYVDGWAEYEVVDNGALDQDPTEGHIVDDAAVGKKESAKNGDEYNLKAVSVELNVQSSIVKEGDSVRAEGKVWNELDAVEANVDINVEKWDGSSWDDVDRERYNHSFGDDENKTFTHIWSAEPGRYRFTVVADPEDEINEENESDNEESTELNVPSWATVYGDVTVTRVLGSGEHIFYSWSAPNDGTVIFYDVDAGEVDVEKLQAMTTTAELEKADEVLEMVGNPDCILCRYDENGDGDIDNWHVFNIAGRNVNAPVFEVDDWPVGILWEGEGTAFTGSEPIVFITEVRNDQNCSCSGTCDYVAEVPSPLKKQFGAQDEIIIRYVE